MWLFLFNQSIWGIIMGSVSNTEREDKFMQLICMGIPTTEAAIKAGYSEKHAKTSVRRKFNSKRFMAKLADAVDDFPDQRKTIAKAQLKKVARIDDKILDKALTNDDVLMHSNVSKTVDRIYKLTGLLQDDSVTVQAVQINLNMLQGTQEKTLERIDIPLTIDSDDNDLDTHSDISGKFT
jgi:hypothetical protein